MFNPNIQQPLQGAEAAAFDRWLKDGVDTDEEIDDILHVTLAGLTEIDLAQVRSLHLADLDEARRRGLVDQVKAALLSPKKTLTYRSQMTRLRAQESDALKFVEYDGLVALGLLGDKSVIPGLCQWVKTRLDCSARTRIVAGTILRYMTGQDIGQYVLSTEDLTLWEQWWNEHKSTLLNQHSAINNQQ